jgi:putative redox protein
LYFCNLFLNGNTLKNIRYFTNGKDTIEWNVEECMHSGKCLKNIPYIIDKPGTYSINVSESQFDTILNQTDLCPSGALKLKEQK